MPRFHSAQSTKQVQVSLVLKNPDTGEKKSVQVPISKHLVDAEPEQILHLIDDYTRQLQSLEASNRVPYTIPFCPTDEDEMERRTTNFYKQTRSRGEGNDSILTKKDGGFVVLTEANRTKAINYLRFQIKKLQAFYRQKTGSYQLH